MKPRARNRFDASGADPPNRHATPAVSEIAASAENPDEFVRPALATFSLIGRAVLVALTGAWAFDLAAVAASSRNTDEPLETNPHFWLALGGGALTVGAVGMLASIQVRYTFEHARIRKRHFYALKLARRREACAALRSYALKDAVPAVGLLGELRRDTAVLDRRMAMESLRLRWRWRDLTWLPIAGAASGLASATAWISLHAAPDAAALAVPAAWLAAGLLSFIAVNLWAAERVRRVFELLSGMHPDLSKAFDPTPPMTAAIERLLTRVNRHFDRLNGIGAPSFDAVEEEEGAR